MSNDSLLSQCDNQSAGPINNLFGILIQTVLAAQCGISRPEMWPKNYGPTALGNDMEEYDFIVVGAGSAGCVVANRLSENPSWRVLLIEAGGDPPIESEIPAMSFNIQKSQADWSYYTEPSTGSLGMKDSRWYWPRGKMLGGTSALNLMLYVRGNSRDYDNWEAQGNRGWGWSSVLKYFKKSEDNRDKTVALDTRFHSTGGLLKVDHYKSNDPLISVVKQGFQEIGFEPNVDPFGEQYLGYYESQGTLDSGTRCSTAKAFLVPAKDRPNLNVVKHAHVTKLTFDNDDSLSVSGVEFQINDKLLTAKSTKEVILSAGSINTPQILKLSGIGPLEELSKHKIKVRQNLSVGWNLQDHIHVALGIKLHPSTSKPTTTIDMAEAIYQYAVHQNGSLSNIRITELLHFVSTVGDERFPDIQYHMLNFRKEDPLIGDTISKLGYNDAIIETFVNASKESDLLLILATLLNPKSRGRIELASADPLAAPRIFTNYLHMKQDAKVLVNAMHILRAFADTKTIAANEGEEIRLPLPECDVHEFRSDRYSECYVRQMSSTLYHPVGTAKMGPDSDSHAVVNDMLKVKGIRNLRVCDASIMPTIISGNTNAPTVMIGEKCADFIKYFL